MATYLYEATDQKGRIIKGEITALTEEEVMTLLSAKNLIPKVIKLKKEKRRIKLPLWLFSGLSSLDKARLAEQLATLIKAGVSITEAIEILISAATKKGLKNILYQLKENLEKGQPLYTTFALYPRQFSSVFVNLIKAGEVSGNLENILNEIALNYRKEHELKRKILSASLYPIILVIAAVGVIIFIAFFVIPRIVSSYASAGIKLPAFTQAFISFNEFLKANYIIILAAVFLIFITLTLIGKIKAGRLFFARIKLFLPVFGKISKNNSLNWLCRNLSMLLRSGMPIREALEITASAVENDIYKKLLLENLAMVEKGISLSNSLKIYPKYFPPLVTGTLLVAEQTGKIDEMLAILSDFYVEEVDRNLETLTTTLQPILLIIIGTIVGFLALSLILPIYQFIKTVA